MKSTEIRKAFLDYFKEKGHAMVPSSGLLPKGDPTLLFTNAGMVQFKGVFLGDEKRDYTRAVSCQKCVRAGGKHNDLENVGRTARHHTFFEMLGNFSFGDYFKEDAIEYGWEFLTKVMALPEDKLYATVYEKDDEAAEIWAKRVGLSPERIVRLGEKDNFWAMGETGPCGPCSEILIDQGEELSCGSADCAPGCDCDRYLELWNLVFMQYNRNGSGEMTELPKPSIDTGMGLERLTAVMQGKKNNYDTDLFAPIINLIEELSKKKYGVDSETDVSIRAVADHARAATFLISDGILPSNEGRGYVLRRIIRRAARHGRNLGITKPFLYVVNGAVTDTMCDAYPELDKASDLVAKATGGEEERFFETLEKGLAILEEEVASLKKKKKTALPGDAAFRLYDTYGFPLDLTADILRGEGLTVDEAGFNDAMETQRAKARSSWKGSGEEAGDEVYKGLTARGLTSEFVGYGTTTAASKVNAIIKGGEETDEAKEGDEALIVTEETPFYGESGGQAGDTGTISTENFSAKVEETLRPAEGLIVHRCTVERGSVKMGDTVELTADEAGRLATAQGHTATHLLHAALRRVLGDHVRQAGSLVTPTGLRFDFNHFSAVSDDELRRIEEAANMDVIGNEEVQTETLPHAEAIKKGALAFFGDKYGDEVRMVRAGQSSTELCGGTHVARTGDIGPIRITSESSVASGVRRLEAVTGEAALTASMDADAVLKESAALLKSSRSEVPEKIGRIIEKVKELEKEAAGLRSSEKAAAAGDLIDRVTTVAGVKVLAADAGEADGKALREMADTLRQKLGSGIVVLGGRSGDKVSILAAVTKDLVGKFNAGEIVKALAPIVGGKGGGRADMAQAGGKDPKKLEAALDAASSLIEGMSKV